MKDNKFQLEIETAIKATIFVVILYLLPSGHGITFWMSVGFAILGWIAYVVGIYRVRSLIPHGKSSFYECEMQLLVDRFIKMQIVACLVFTLIGRWLPIWLPMIF